MRPYFAVLSARFRMLLQYRAAAAAGIGTRIFWGLIRMMIFEAFYRSAAGPQPMSYRQVVIYVWLGQAMLAMILWSVDSDVQAMIKTGTVAYELVRPLDLYGLWYARALAARTAPTLLQAPLVMAAAAVLFGLPPPPSWAAAAAWIATTAGAFLLCAAIATLVTVSLLWTVAGDGISRMVPTLLYSFSGMLVPLPLFPRWLQPAIAFLPFRGLIDVPFRTYMGAIAPVQALPLVGQQLGWTLVFVALGHWLLSRGLKRLVVQGG